MNRFHIILYLKTHLYQTLISPLACAFLTTEQYNSIQNIYNSPVLSSIGFNHTWPAALRFGDDTHYGLQIRHLESETLIIKLQQL